MSAPRTLEIKTVPQVLLLHGIIYQVQYYWHVGTSKHRGISPPGALSTVNNTLCDWNRSNCFFVGDWRVPVTNGDSDVFSAPRTLESTLVVLQANQDDGVCSKAISTCTLDPCIEYRNLSEN